VNKRMPGLPKIDTPGLGDAGHGSDEYEVSEV
jgi:hypothetical protein